MINFIKRLTKPKPHILYSKDGTWKIDNRLKTISPNFDSPIVQTRMAKQIRALRKMTDGWDG